MTVTDPTIRDEPGIAETVKSAFSAVLPQASWDPARSFYALGGDSLTFVAFTLQLGTSIPEERLRNLRPDLPLELMVREVAGALDGPADPSPWVQSRTQPDDPRDVPLTANRHQFLFAMPTHMDEWVHASLLHWASLPFDERALVGAARALTDQFDGLRLGFYRRGGEWRQHIHEALTQAGLVSIAEASGPGDPAILDRAEEAAGQIRLGGDLFRVLAFPAPGRDSFGIIFLSHHALVDGQSNRIIRHYFFDAYRSLLDGKAPASRAHLPYRDYCTAYYDDCRRSLDEALAFWRAKPWTSLRAPPSRPAELDPRETRTAEVSAPVPLAGGTERVRTFARRTGALFNQVAIGGVARAFGEWCGSRWLHLGLVVRGRGGLPGNLDPGGTVGWTTETVPLLVPTTGSSRELAGHVGEEIAAIQRFGRTYNYLRYLCPDPAIRAEFGRHALPNLTLNIMTKPEDVVENVERLPFGWDSSWRGERVFPVTGGLVTDATSTELSWDFDQALFCPADMQSLLDLCVARIGEAMIAADAAC